jgi:DNA-binding transcriptional regulator YiaG
MVDQFLSSLLFQICPQATSIIVAKKFSTKQNEWNGIKQIGLTPLRYHLATRMGIATALVRSWEDGSTQPNEQQMKILAGILNFHPRSNSVESLWVHHTGGP